jgi:hypothetical protein
MKSLRTCKTITNWTEVQGLLSKTDNTWRSGSHRPPYFWRSRGSTANGNALRPEHPEHLPHSTFMDTNADANVPMSCPRNPVTTRKLSDASVTPDVAIQIGEIEYHLHAIELRSRSKFFDRSLSTTWWRPENTHSGADGIKYRYKLVLDQKDPLMSLLEPVSPREVDSLVVNMAFVC